MSRKSLIVSIAAAFAGLLVTNRFLFNESWDNAFQGSLFVAIGSLVATALVLRGRR